jgi:hypothetical protein
MLYLRNCGASGRRVEVKKSMLRDLAAAHLKLNKVKA